MPRSPASANSFKNAGSGFSRAPVRSRQLAGAAEKRIVALRGGFPRQRLADLYLEFPRGSRGRKNTAREARSIFRHCLVPRTNALASREDARPGASVFTLEAARVRGTAQRFGQRQPAH